MITGKTESGFEFQLDEENLDDYELLENLCDIDNGDASKITIAANQLLGKEQMKALKEHVRNEKGRVLVLCQDLVQVKMRNFSHF